MNPNIRFFEVAPRDGLQNENTILSLEEKLRFIQLLSEAGCKDIEAGAFVHPDLVPQMANSKELLPLAILSFPEVNLHALTPNLKGLKTALGCGITHIGLLTSLCSTFSKRNLNATFQESIDRVQKITEEAPTETYKRLYLSMSFFSTWSGKISNEIFKEKAQIFSQLKVDEFVLSDTNGRARAEDIHEKTSILKEFVEVDKIACHFHDTYDHALENTKQAWSDGISSFDSSCGGIGGCPYSPGASGNISTKMLVDFFKSQGVETHINLDLLAIAAAYINQKLTEV
jgi:hydroxymethylglutaryl-CoA lyase